MYGGDFMKRSRVNRKVDARVFRSTAKKTHRFNVDAPIMRGGIRL